MPRYTLILSDEIYVKALQKASAEGKTLGRWINDLIKKELEKEEEKKQ